MSSTSVPRTRLSPEERRAQLVGLGVELLKDHSLSQITPETLAEAAGVSRGLLYHYFGGADGVQLAVVRRLAEDLVVMTAPVEFPTPVETLHHSVGVFLEYLENNTGGYLAIRRGGSAGSTEFGKIYAEARSVLIDRIFEIGLIEPTALVRKITYGWAAFAEDLMLSWIEDPDGIEREELLSTMIDALMALVALRMPAEVGAR